MTHHAPVLLFIAAIILIGIAAVRTFRVGPSKGPPDIVDQPSEPPQTDILSGLGDVALTKARPSQSAPAPPQPLKREEVSRAKRWFPTRFVVFDLETTGLDASRHEIIEIGAIKVGDTLPEHQTFSTLVMPTGRISRQITELTGINRKMIKAEGMDLRPALEAFREFVGGYHIVSFNAPFDLAFLRAACQRAGVAEFRNASSCALALAREAWPGRRSYRLSRICRDHGIWVKGEHQALPDCERALRVYTAAVEVLG